MLRPGTRSWFPARNAGLSRTPAFPLQRSLCCRFATPSHMNSSGNRLTNATKRFWTGRSSQRIIFKTFDRHQMLNRDLLPSLRTIDGGA